MPPWRSMFEANVAATERLLAAFAAAGWRGRFVHVSTFAVYGLQPAAPDALVDEADSARARPGPARRLRVDEAAAGAPRSARRSAEQGSSLVVVRPGAGLRPRARWQHRVGPPALRERRRRCSADATSAPLLRGDHRLAELAGPPAWHPAAAGETFNAVDPDPADPARLGPGALARSRWPGADDLLRPRPAGPRLRLAGRGRSRAAEQRRAGAVAPPALLPPVRDHADARPFRYAPSRAAEALGWQAPVARDEALRRTLDGWPLEPGPVAAHRVAWSGTFRSPRAVPLGPGAKLAWFLATLVAVARAARAGRRGALVSAACRCRAAREEAS